MTVKYERLRKRVLLETGLIVAILAVMGGVVYFVDTIRDDYETSNHAIQKQIDAIDTEMNALRAKFINIQKNLDLYQEVQKRQAAGRLSINRDMLVEKFNQFKTLYALSSMHMVVSPTQETKDAAFKHKNSSVNFSEVIVNFDSISDENVYRLVDSLREELAGASKLTKFDIALQKTFDAEVLQAVSQKGYYPLVKTEIRFIWFGINSTIKMDSRPDAPKT